MATQTAEQSTELGKEIISSLVVVAGTEPRKPSVSRDGWFSPESAGNVLSRIAEHIRDLYDWFSGPAMPDRDRITASVAKAQDDRRPIL